MRRPVASHRDLRAVDRRDSQLWGVSCILIAALAAGFFVVRVTAPAPGASWERTMLYGQSVLIVLTLGYFVQKRRELARVRRHLIQEKMQRANLRDRYDALGATLAFTTRIGAIEDPAAALRYTVEQTLTALRAHHCLIGLGDEPAAGPPRLASHASAPGARNREAAEAAWAEVSAWVAGRDASLFMDAAGDPAAAAPATAGDAPSAPNLGGVIAVPLRMGGRTSGALMLALDVPDGTSRRRFGRYDLRVAEIIANAVAAALDNTRLTTRLKHRRDQLRKSLKQLRIAQSGVILGERLKAMEELVDKVAHYISNPLTTISGYAQLLGTQELDVELKQFLGTIGEEVERCNQAINDLKSFAHRPPSEPRSSDLNQLLKQALFLKAHRFERLSIESRFDAAPVLGAVVIDPIQIQQAFLIVLTDVEKAAERADGGIRLDVRSESRGERIHIRFAVRPRNSERRAAVMQPPWQPFADEPVAPADSLLPRDLLHAVVRAHGGRSHVEFDPDTRTTTFTIALPHAEASPAAEAAAEIPGASPSAANAAGRASILVVDDEERIVSLFRRVLANEGFRVTAVTSGREALTLLEDQRFDAVVLDYHMPEVGAREVVDFLAARRPDLLPRLILISGDDQSASFHRLADRAGAATLAKPFQISEMLEVVESRIASPDHA